MVGYAFLVIRPSESKREHSLRYAFNAARRSLNRIARDRERLDPPV